jgi:kumamolisin
MDSERPELDLVPLAGSERSAAPGVSATQQGVKPGTRIEATLVLRRREPLDDSVLFESPTPLRSPRELGERFGADPTDVTLVVETVGELGLQIVSTDAASRRVRIAGPVELVTAVFGTDLRQVTSKTVTGASADHRHRTGALSIPRQLDGIVTAVLGLDDRPQSHAQFRIAQAEAVTASYTPVQVGAFYDFPPNTDGAGQSIAIVELGGGFAQGDLDTYFSGLGLATPTVSAVGVDGAANQPGKDPNGADGEVLLDIEVIGALAPAADIRVYFAPNTDAGFLDAVSDAAHASPTPVAISISWGQSEDDWTAQARNALDAAMTDAAALGITVTAASGDDGSTDRATDGKAHVDFPASSPHALACGGTRLEGDATNGTVTSEVVWNNGSGQGASGGGVSDAFTLPGWQRNAGVPMSQGRGGGRGVPDVAGNADPETGYRVRVDGTDMVIGGTSAVSPLWAALIGRLAQSTGRGFALIQPALYGTVAAGQVAPGFRDVTQGDNGAFHARAGWDACTGLGVPEGTALLGLLDPKSS